MSFASIVRIITKHIKAGIIYANKYAILLEGHLISGWNVNIDNKNEIIWN